MTDIPCASDALSRSVCMIRYALDDVGKASGGVAEGGIAQIKAASSTSYTVSLPREERIQTFTYEFAVTGDKLHFVRRTEATQGF